MTALHIGAHVGNGETDGDPLADAVARGADLVQLFLGDPQGWAAPVFPHPDGAAGLRAAAAEAGLDVVVHAPYRINVASPNNRIRIPSRKLLQQHVDAAAEVGAIALVVHGGHVGAGGDLDAGFDSWRKCVERLELRCPVLIENTAGGEGAMARRLDAIGRLWDAVGDSGVGFCLDTCHAHAGGISLDGVVDAVRAITGRIDLVHANGSRDPFDSGADRHANLGAPQDHIDPDDVVGVVRGAKAPALVETPGGVAGQGADIELLRAKV